MEVGYRLRRDRWGSSLRDRIRPGLAAGRLRALEALDEIVGVVQDTNPASVRVLEKAGLPYAGDGAAITTFRAALSPPGTRDLVARPWLSPKRTLPCVPRAKRQPT